MCLQHDQMIVGIDVGNSLNDLLDVGRWQRAFLTDIPVQRQMMSIPGDQFAVVEFSGQSVFSSVHLKTVLGFGRFEMRSNREQRTWDHPVFVEM